MQQRLVATNAITYSAYISAGEKVQRARCGLGTFGGKLGTLISERVRSPIEAGEVRAAALLRLINRSAGLVRG